MCRKVASAEIEHCVGYYSKGNEPKPIVMKIMVAPCVCGEVFWAKVPNGYVWIEAEKEWKPSGKEI